MTFVEIGQGSSLVFAHGGSGSSGGSGLASFGPVWMLLGSFGVVFAVLWARGRPNPEWGRLRFLSRAPDSLERLTGLPGWAASAIGLALFGLVLAGQGFYSDVAWHIAYGRDDDLLTSPHTSILAGLLFIVAGAVLGSVVATLDRVPDTVAVPVLALRIPRSLLPMWALGLGALAGFPVDDIWHRTNGVDVTMWSPTHMLMILGASLTGLAAWLVLGSTGVGPTTSRWGRGLHVTCAWLTLEGLIAPLGEFTFGVPQFSLLYAPILVCLAAGLALVAMRLVLGTGWTLGISIAAFAFMASGRDRDLPINTRFVGVFIVSAVFVELAAYVLGTDRRLRFAIVSGVGIGTLGLAAEWVWNEQAHQPWTTSLLPTAAVLGTIVAVATAVIGAALAPALGAAEPPAPNPTRLAGRTAWLALATTVVVLMIPLNRGTGNVTASVHLDRAGPGQAYVEARVEPLDAAADAYWFQATAWQGGGLVLATMQPTGTPGQYRSDVALPIEGHWKTLLRLHRAGEMMAIPVYLPADPSIDAAEIPAVDRQAAFEVERKYLLRETRGGNAWLTLVVHGFFAFVCALWAIAFAAAMRPPRPREQHDRRSADHASALVTT